MVKMSKTSRLPFGIEANDARSLTAQVADGIRSAIFSGFWKHGDTLPTRAELTRALGVSDNVVRAAMSRISAEGLVRTRPHVGSVVLRKSSARLNRRAMIIVSEGNGAYSDSVFLSAIDRRLRRVGIVCEHGNVYGDIGYRSKDYAALEMDIGNRPDIVIAHGVWSNSTARKLDSYGVPYVLVGGASRFGRHKNCLARIPVDWSPAVEDFADDCARNRVTSVCCLGFGGDEWLDPEPALTSRGIFVEKRAFPKDYIFTDLESVQRAARAMLERRMEQGKLADVLFFLDDYIAFGALPLLLERGIRIPEDVRVVTQYNHGFGPVIGKSLARIETDFRAYGDELGSAVVDWFLTGRFRNVGDFAPRYVRGETFPSCRS